MHLGVSWRTRSFMPGTATSIVPGLPGAVFVLWRIQSLTRPPDRDQPMKWIRAFCARASSARRSARGEPAPIPPAPEAGAGARRPDRCRSPDTPWSERDPLDLGRVSSRDRIG